MKKVLSLLLALTMVLGFASTAMAASYRYFDLFEDGFDPAFTVDGLEYSSWMDVDGTDEVTVKFSFDADNLATFVNSTDFFEEISLERRFSRSSTSTAAVPPSTATGRRPI